jgi:threonine dehydrogenase-like Zn-dependent dehydrogenase
MKAVTWQGRRGVRHVDVPDPKIEQGTDAVTRVTSTNICGSDLHLYEVLGAFMEPGDVLGHEAMGIVEEVGDQVSAIKPRDRVVILFQMSVYGGDPLGVERFATHRIPVAEAPHAYEQFQEKAEGTVKVVMTP